MDGADELRRRLASAWSPRTASTWTPANPAKGQCSVTAIAVQRIAGGDILKTPTPDGLHFYNRIGGVRFDFTAGQFAQSPEYRDLPSDADDALSDTSPEQVAALLEALGERA